MPLAGSAAVPVGLPTHWSALTAAATATIGSYRSGQSQLVPADSVGIVPSSFLDLGQQPRGASSEAVADSSGIQQHWMQKAGGAARNSTSNNVQTLNAPRVILWQKYTSQAFCQSDTGVLA